jgi:hypothetical protein
MRRSGDDGAALGEAISSVLHALADRTVGGLRCGRLQRAQKPAALLGRRRHVSIST